jgi:phosphoribosylglycinamide formyltransferase-1
VLEYNCRSGDPETQVVLPLVADDLFPWLVMAAGGRLYGRPQTLRGSAVGVVMAAEGYPDAPVTGVPIDGLDALPSGTVAFHAGTASNGSGEIVTAGGRVLTVVGMGRTIDEAAARAYAAPVRFAGMQRRSDIGWQARGQMSDVGCQMSDLSAGEPPESAGSRSLVALARQSSPSNSSGTGTIHASAFARQPARFDGQPKRAKALGYEDAHENGLSPNGSEERPRIAVLASGAGSNLQALIDARADGGLGAEIGVVVSHNPRAGALHRARSAGIPAFGLVLADHHDPIERAGWEQRLLDLLAPFHPDLIVLAGWMVILSADFLERCGCPIINIHPALLDSADGPVLRGMHAVRDALALGLSHTGVTVHRVTPAVDDGPVLLTERIPILSGDSEDSLYARIKPVEHRLIVDAVQMMLCSAPLGGVHA